MSFKFKPKPAMEELQTGDVTPEQPNVTTPAQDSTPSLEAMFKEIVQSFKEKFCCYDLSHMKIVASTVPMNHDGDEKTNEGDRVKYTGSWTKLDTIYINPDMSQAMKFYDIEGKVSQENLQRQAIAHELAHELYEYQMDDKCIDKIVKKAEDLKFDTPYLHHIDDDDPKEELFCEYMAYRITGIWIKI